MAKLKVINTQEGDMDSENCQCGAWLEKKTDLDEENEFERRD